MKVFYFTNSYPYGQPDHWKTIELKNLVDDGHQVTVIPFSYGSNSTLRIPLDHRVQYLLPLVSIGSISAIVRTLLRAIFSKLLFYFLGEFLSKKVNRSRLRFNSWLRDSYYTAALYFHPAIKDILATADEQTLLYFFWGRHSALIIPLLKDRRFRIACRFHGYDLYVEQNNGYIPYQEKIIRNCDLVLPCSEFGADYIKQRFELEDSKLFIARIGVPKAFDVSSIPGKGAFSIISCSPVVPVKRLSLLAESLEYIPFDIQWTHIGDGSSFRELSDYCKRYTGTNKVIDLRGHVLNDLIPAIFQQKGFDLFINVSASEGVPVSIMEAMAAGIPIMATDVGGTSEVVSGFHGILLKPDISARELAASIISFYQIDKAVKEKMSAAAKHRYREICKAETNAQILIKRFYNLFS